MDLMQRHQVGAARDRFDGESAIGSDRFAIVVGAEADVETRADTDGGAATPTQEAVGHALERPGADHLNRHGHPPATGARSEEHTSELQSLMRTSYAVFC